jgi:CoA-transferase family III
MEVATWAASGAMALTGRPRRAPLGPPAGLVAKLAVVGAMLAERSAALGRRVEVDPIALLGERAAIAGLTRQGAVSCGGGTHLLPARDGWLAVSLARADDLELLDAWLGVAVTGPDAWEAVGAAVAAADVEPVVRRARLLGLPVAALPSAVAPVKLAGPPLVPLPVRAESIGPAAPRRDLRDLRVVDLSSLWAGPLCGSLLADAGATVVKVESTSRPDSARQGPAPLFDLLNHRKQSVAVDLTTAAGAQALHALLAAADVVIEASRPRALEQLGIDAHELLRSGRPQVWVSLTGHGRTEPHREWVAFGDDGAVAGGLVAWDDEGPCFCADAIADPAAGLVAAAAALDALATGGHWLLDVSLAQVAAHLAGPTLPVTDAAHQVEPPRARPPSGAAAPLGADTNGVFANLAHDG